MTKDGVEHGIEDGIAEEKMRENVDGGEYDSLKERMYDAESEGADMCETIGDEVSMLTQTQGWGWVMEQIQMQVDGIVICQKRSSTEVPENS